MSLNGNPFLNLFNTGDEAQRFIQQNLMVLAISEDTESTENPLVVRAAMESRDDVLLQEIFLFATDSVSVKRSEVLHTLALKHFQTLGRLNLENLACLIYERLMSGQEIDELIRSSGNTSEPLERSPAYETNPIKYLYESFGRMMQLFPKSLQPFEKNVVNYDEMVTAAIGDEENESELKVWRICWQVMRDQAIIFFEMPSLIEGFNPIEHLQDLAMSQTTWDKTDKFTFYSLVISHMGSDTNPVLEIVRPILKYLHNWTRDSLASKSTQNLMIPHGIHLFSKKSPLAMALLRFDREVIVQSSFENSLIGGLLSLGSRSDFFKLLTDNMDDPRYLSQERINGLEKDVHTLLEEVQRTMVSVFRGMFHLSDVKKELLTWIGDALHHYKDRNKLWNLHYALPLAVNSSDSFLLNLQFVLLELFSPVLNNSNKSGIALIEPTYCSATVCSDRKDALARDVHMRSNVSVTCLIPACDGQGNSVAAAPPTAVSVVSAAASNVSSTVPTLPAVDTSALSEAAAPATSTAGLKEKYNFATEMFFMIHSCCNLGFSVISEKLVKANQEIHQIRERYKELVDQGLSNSTRALQLKDQLQFAVTIFYSIKTALMQDSLMDKYFSFSVFSADYLVHIARPPGIPGKKNIFPLVAGGATCTSPSPLLQHIPEFLVQNIRFFLLFLRRFKDGFFEEHKESLGKLFDFLLLFMSESKFIHNPHLRAEMAEALECLFPRPEDPLANRSMFTLDNSSFYREKLLVEHENARHITHCLMGLFVGMEATGQGVQFENKFRYRQPMYIMFKYLWKLDIHKQALKDAVEYAEQHLEDADAPLFLRFINLLVNDSIYLLDEALSLMSQIKEKQLAKESGEWDSLPPNQRQEAESSLKHLGLLARFHNIMGVETIETLATLTANVRSIFVQTIMVDRLADMLNYFLLHLVGPKKLNLKVKNPEQFRFEPKKFVSEICRIYENLSDSERFLRAVSSDGRSYSQDLFVRASEVLCKIKEPLDRITKFDEISQKIKELAVEQAKEEELKNIPEDYLDPIMGTIMNDPVLLPSSGKIVDRQMIARHILSDQTDPFNRQPLTMDMIRPVVELKLEIESWLANNKKSCS